MAIPTQFSVTSIPAGGVSIGGGIAGPINAPIANPSAPPVEPSVLAPESLTGIGAPSTFAAELSSDIDTPSFYTAEFAAFTRKPLRKSSKNKAAIAPPNPLATASATPLLPGFPRNHARILYENKLENRVNISTNGGVTPENILIPNTFQRWSFTASGTDTIRVDMGAVIQCDTFCIGAHNLQGAEVRIGVDATLNGTTLLVANKIATSNAPIMFHLDTPIDVGRVQITIVGASGAKYIGYFSAGIALQMQRPFFNGHTPITDGDATQYYSNRTESGEIIGQQIRRQGFETSADWQNIDDTWYRTYFAPFKQAAKLRPFFFAWNLLEYPDDVGFCRISQDVSAPMQNGTRTKRSISMNLLGAG